MEPSEESLALSKLLAKFIEDSDKEGSIAETVKNFVLSLKDEARHHNEGACEYAERGADCDKGCIGAHVMKILHAAQNMRDPMYEEMDMAMRLQIKTGVNSAIHMVK